MARFAMACAGLVVALAGSEAMGAEPPFENSIVSTDFDFILDSDPDAQESFRYVKRARKEMPDKRTNELFADAYVFEMVYTGEDGGTKTIEIWANTDFGSLKAATPYARHLARAIGQQPAFLRESLRHVVLHSGDETAFAEESGGFFVIYAENMDTRLANHDLQETVFHESAHVALEAAHATAEGWVAAQEADGGFITRYAERLPAKEDVPESAIFAWVVLNHPGRLPAEVEAVVREVMPNRLAYLAGVEGFVAGPGTERDGGG